MYLVYKLFTNEEVKLSDGFSISVDRINQFKGVHFFLWSLFKGSGFYKIYSLKKDGTVVCTAEVLNHCPFLRFLPSQSIHIGPCHTPEQHRGNGYYPMLIKYITGCYKGHDCYMFVKDDNYASIRGIEKAGFNRIGECKKFLNVYYTVLDK